VEALAGPVVVVSALLALAGGMKVVQPASTVGALRAMRLPSSPGLVRMLGVVEVAVAIGAGITFQRSLLALLAALYLAFAAFVAAALGAHTPLQSCGCFGRADTPPSVVHLGVNLAAAVVALAAAVSGTPSLSDTLSEQPWVGLPFVLLVAVSVYLCVTLLTVLPLTMRSRQIA
jgi:hypothetical protein